MSNEEALDRINQLGGREAVLKMICEDRPTEAFAFDRELLGEYLDQMYANCASPTFPWGVDLFPM